MLGSKMHLYRAINAVDVRIMQYNILLNNVKEMSLSHIVTLPEDTEILLADTKLNQCRRIFKKINQRIKFLEARKAALKNAYLLYC